MNKLDKISLKMLLISISIGVWIMVLQNAGIIPRLVGAKNGVQTVYVEGGKIAAHVRGTVDIDDVHGTVNVNIE